MIKYIDVKNPDSKISFCAPRDKSGPWKGYSWSREMFLDGKKMFEYGPNCETCEFYMKQVGNTVSSVTIDSVRDRLNSDVTELSDDLVFPLSTIPPAGTYGVVLREVMPVFDAQPDFYAAEDTVPYLVNSKEISKAVNESGMDGEGYKYGRITAKEYILPMRKNSGLDGKRISHYENMPPGNSPCAVSLSFLEMHGRGDYDIFMLHFLLDGHHKIEAAANMKKPVKLLSFISCEMEYNVLIFLHNHWRRDTDISHVKKSIEYMIENVLT